MPITLKNNGESIEINELGFIESWSLCDQISSENAIYLVLFEEYSRINPFCTPFDVSDHIAIISQDESSIVYGKTFQEFTFHYSIKIIESGIDWSIKFATNSANHSVGLAIPFFNNMYDFNQELITDSVSYYSSFLHKNIYPDQHMMNIPAVFSNNFCIFGNMKNNYQFFKYDDNQSPWLRITTSTSNIDDNEIEICLRKTDYDNMSNIYLKKFPETEKFVNRWKIKFEDLGNRFGININYQQTETTLKKDNDIYKSNSFPTEVELQNFYPKLKHELDKYPLSIFKKLKITNIMVVSDLWIETDKLNKKIDGQIWGNRHERGIIIDMQASPSVIHHEIFHAIQGHTSIDDMPGKVSQISDIATITNAHEYLAEIFRILMTSPGRIHTMTSKDLPEQIEYVQKMANRFITFPQTVVTTDHRQIIAITPTGIQEIEFGDICPNALRYQFRTKLCQ